MADSLAQIADSAQNGPHRREYYLAQIPFTQEQMEASNKTIEDGLYNSGVIFKDKLDNLTLSEKQLRRLVDNYPDYEGTADAFYHLYLLYMRKQEPRTADEYVERLKQQYPDNEWTTLLSDPHYVENARFGIAIEDSLYAATYDAFKASRYSDVTANVEISNRRYPLGANRDKFIFIGGLGKLNEGDAEGCIADMKTVVEKYPQSGVAQMAGMIVKGVDEGRRLHGGKFDLAGMWDRRTVVLRDSDSTAVQELSTDRNAAFVYTIVYNPDSLNENRLMFELARYNFTSYLVRNFDINIEEADGLRRITISGFRNYDEALQYARQLHTQAAVTRLVGKNRSLIVSETNLPLLGRQFSYADYDKFYAKHFAPLKTSDEPLLNEPDAVTTPEAPSSNEENDSKQNKADGFNEFDIQDNTGGGSSTTTVLEEEPAVKKETNQSEVILEATPKTQPVEKPKEEPKTQPKEELITLPKEEPKTQPKEEPKTQPTVKPKENLEEEFYFGDDTPSPANKQKKDKNKNIDNDLESDEYYDLDGF